MKGQGPKLLFMAQAISPEVFALAERCSEEFGLTWLHTGTDTSGWESPGSQLRVFRGPRFDNRTLRSRARSWLAYTLAALRFASSVPGQPRLVLSSNPPILPLVGYLCRKRRGWRYLVRVLDIYPDVPTQHTLFSERHPLARLWRQMNRTTYGDADRLVTLGEVMASRLKGYAPQATIDILPDWVDTHAIMPRPKTENRFAQEYGLDTGLSVVYSGNYGESHELEGFFEAMVRLRGDDGFRFALIGGGGRADALKAAAERAGRNAVYLPFQPSERLPELMAAADVGVVALGRGGVGASMPSKCYSVMAAGGAVLGLSDGANDLRRVIERHRCGVNVKPSDPEAIANALRELRDQPQRLAELRENARKAAVECFDAEVVMGHYVELMAGWIERTDG